MKNINPFKQIEETKKVINELKYNHQFIKDKVRKKKNAKRINTLIDTVQMFDGMLLSKYKTNAIDKLIYALFYEYALMYSNNRIDKNGNKDGFPIYTIVEHIDEAIRYAPEYKQMQIISILKDYELEEKIKNNSVFDKNYTNFEHLLKRLLTEFKTSMIWTK